MIICKKNIIKLGDKVKGFIESRNKKRKRGLV